MATEKICEYCGRTFIATHGRSKFCCPACRIKWYNENYKPEKGTKKCVICGAEFTPWNRNQVTCGKKECVKTNSNNKKKRGAYLYAKNGGLNMRKKATPKRRKPWEDCTPEERWERMNLTELSGEIARRFPGMSFGDVRLLKERGELPDDFGKDVRG